MVDITDARATSHPGAIRWFAVVLLIAYLALLAIGTGSVWVIAGGGTASWIAAPIFALVYLLGWRIWLAAGSTRRLTFKERATVHVVSGTIVVVLGSLAHLLLPAIVALSIVVMCDALDEP